MIPALVQWEITDRCNLRCPHCYHVDPEGNIVRGEELDDKRMMQIAELLVQHRLFFVTFTGGEPLVRRDLLINLAQYLSDHNIVLSLNTNLLQMDDGLLSRLRVHRMLVSCPSTNPETYRRATGNGDYERFEEKLRLLVDAKTNFTVNMVVSRTNFQEVRATASHLAALGVRRFAATPASVNARFPNYGMLLEAHEVQQVINDLIWAHENLGLEVDIMESIPKCLMPPRAFELELPFVFRSCHAGRRNGTVSTNGDVRPCSHNPRTFGNVLREDINVIWDRVGQWRQTSGNYNTACLSCDMFNACGGGCRVDAAVRQGQNDAPHPYMTDERPTTPSRVDHCVYGPEMIIRPVKTFQSREEDGMWLVAPGSSRNIIKVNRVLYDFLVGTRTLPPMTIRELAQRYDTTHEDVEFQRVIRQLTRSKFFIVH